MPEIRADNSTVTRIADLQNRQAGIPTDSRGKPLRVAKEKNDALGKDAFLKLLVTQLSKQDPLNPVNDKEFISQMASFSSLEQMNNVAESMNSVKSFQASFLVGKEVTGTDFVSGREISGLVKRVIYDNTGQTFLKLESGTVNFKKISSVSMPEQKAGNVSRETMLNSAAQAYSENTITKPQLPPGMSVDDQVTINKTIQKGE